MTNLYVSYPATSNQQPATRNQHPAGSGEETGTSAGAPFRESKGAGGKESEKRIDEETKRKERRQRSKVRGQKNRKKGNNQQSAMKKRKNKLQRSRDAMFHLLGYIKPKLFSKQYAISNKTRSNQHPATSNQQPIDRAYQLFRHHLEQFRQYYPVKTICMHGNPKSPFDSRDIWQEYNYRNLGILGEPYFDIDFNEVFYLTDTGRRWDGWKVSIRDKDEAERRSGFRRIPEQQQWINQGFVFHSTKDIIRAAQNNRLPNKIMITTHPQRWTDSWLPWVRELVWQAVKNFSHDRRE